MLLPLTMVNNQSPVVLNGDVLPRQLFTIIRPVATPPRVQSPQKQKSALIHYRIDSSSSDPPRSDSVLPADHISGPVPMLPCLASVTGSDKGQDAEQHWGCGEDPILSISHLLCLPGPWGLET